MCSPWPVTRALKPSCVRSQGPPARAPEAVELEPGQKRRTPSSSPQCTRGQRVDVSALIVFIYKLEMVTTALPYRVSVKNQIRQFM